MKESFRSDFGLYANNNISSLYKNDVNYVDNEDSKFIPYDSPFDTYGNMTFGTGAIGDIRQDIGHSIRGGFGRETGSFFPRSVRRRFNIEFQRGSYNKCKTGINEYMYECGIPSSYYPITYVNSYPYSKNYDPYPYHEDDVAEFCEKRQPKLIRTENTQVQKNYLGVDTINVIFGLLFIFCVFAILY